MCISLGPVLRLVQMCKQIRVVDVPKKIKIIHNLHKDLHSGL